MLVKEAIKYLGELDPDEKLVITWWSMSEDFADYSDTDQVLDLAESALDNCIGHVNDWVASEYVEEEDEE